MAHPEQAFFVAQCKKFFPAWFAGTRVLEIGSLNINGTVRDFFDGCQYIGINIGAGPGVDVVASGERFAGRTGAFDVVISCETMEHDPYWRDTFDNAARMMAPSGLMIVSCASYGRRQHGTPQCSPGDSPLTVTQGSHYYRNLGAADFRALGDLDARFSWHAFFVDYVIHDLYFLGLGADNDGQRATARAFAEELAHHLRAKNAFGIW